jgi:hypothetical protein
MRRRRTRRRTMRRRRTRRRTMRRRKEGWKPTSSA